MSIKKNLASLVVAAGLAFSSGCASYQVSTPDYVRPDFQNYLTDYQNDFLRDKAKEHFLYHVVPLSSDQIKPYDIGHWITWNLFGNEPAGIFGEDWKKELDYPIRFSGFARWTTYNPLHNFCFYTIGFVDAKKKESLAIVNSDKKLFFKKDEKPPISAKGNPALNIYLNNYRPFVSFTFPSFPGRHFDFYFGWRPGGALGARAWPFRKNDNHER